MVLGEVSAPLTGSWGVSLEDYPAYQSAQSLSVLRMARVTFDSFT
jgi:hypothetical protein